ncbi:MAG: hypothetical protein JSR98_02260 [Proteobacteria bacterium]|nr:hypothetical protein [Pseudomonadota bacterium]
MDQNHKASPPGRAPLLSREEIEALMQGPVKDWPSVIVVGDDDVVGFTPARATPLEDPLRRA